MGNSSARTGTKKVATGRKVDKTQFGIEGVLVDEVLKDLNGTVKIIGARIVVGKGFNKHNVPISNKLRVLGVDQLREHKPAQEAVLVFDETSKKNIKTKVESVAKLIDADPRNAYFRYLTVTNGTATGKFQRCTKDIKENTADKRKKLAVLGLTDAKGKISTLISDLHAKKYVCNIKEEVVPFIMCSRG
jgi:hypothetical protein